MTPIVNMGLTLLQDRDGALKRSELDDLFSTSPENPWARQNFPDTTIADGTGAVTLQGWLAQWRSGRFYIYNKLSFTDGLVLCHSMTTLLDHKTTLAYLAYLGYPDEPRTDALLITRPRKHDRKKGKSTRNVFLCYVCGAAGSGKTSLLRAFAGKPFQEIYEPTKKMFSVVNSVDIDSSEKYLVVGGSFALFCGRSDSAVRFSCRNLGPSTRRRRFGTPRKRTWLMSSCMCMIRVTQIHFRISVIYGYVSNCLSHGCSRFLLSELATIQPRSYTHAICCYKVGS